MSRSSTISVEEQARRRKIIDDALVQLRLEELEPDPIVFTYLERYVSGEMTRADVRNEYAAHLTAASILSLMQGDNSGFEQILIAMVSPLHP